MCTQIMCMLDNSSTGLWGTCITSPAYLAIKVGRFTTDGQTQAFERDVLRHVNMHLKNLEGQVDLVMQSLQGHVQEQFKAPRTYHSL